MRGHRGVAVAFGVWVLSTAVAFAQQDPQISLTPSNIAFGSFCVGTVSDARQTVIRNTAQQGSGQNVVVSSIDRTGSADFTRSAVQPSGPIGPQGTAAFSVTFAPTIRGARTARFRVTARDAQNSNQTTTADLNVTGSGVDRRIGVDASTVSFGDQRVGTRSPTKPLIVRNTGLDPLTITAVRRGGSAARDFRVSAPGLPVTIAAGDFRTINVSFQPTRGGLRRASVVIDSNACSRSSLSVSLVGTGVQPNVIVDPNPIDVGESPIGETSKATPVTVRNNGGAALRITAIQIVSGDAADFELAGLPQLPATLQPDDELIFSVRMTPSEQGQRLANLNVISDAVGAPTFTVTLRGVGSEGSPSPSPSPSATPTATPTRNASPSPSPRAASLAGPPNDALAIVLVVAGVFCAFLGLLGVRRFVRQPEDDV